MNKRDQLLRNARKSDIESIWRTYKKERNKCNNIIKRAKASYHHTILNHTRDNPRKFWNAIRSIFPVKCPNLLPSNEIYKQEERFGDYFANSARKL